MKTHNLHIGTHVTLDGKQLNTTGNIQATHLHTGQTLVTLTLTCDTLTTTPTQLPHGTTITHTTHQTNQHPNTTHNHTNTPPPTTPTQG